MRQSSKRSIGSPIMSGPSPPLSKKVNKNAGGSEALRLATGLDQPVAKPRLLRGRPLIPMPAALLRFRIGSGR